MDKFSKKLGMNKFQYMSFFMAMLLGARDIIKGTSRVFNLQISDNKLHSLSNIGRGKDENRVRKFWHTRRRKAKP